MQQAFSFLGVLQFNTVVTLNQYRDDQSYPVYSKSSLTFAWQISMNVQSSHVSMELPVSMALIIIPANASLDFLEKIVKQVRLNYFSILSFFQFFFILIEINCLW